MFFWVMKYVLLGPPLRLLFRPRATGLENVPAEGPAILAANHVSPLDTLLLPLVIPRRRVVFLAKAEYFKKWHTRWFFKWGGSIPIERGSHTAAGQALRGAVEALRRGELVGIFPEGTRSPDGRMYRARTGVARLALSAGSPVVPVALVGTFEAMPYDRKVPRLRPTEVRFGKPIPVDPPSGHAPTKAELRSTTDRIMEEIRRLSGQEYVDEYASEAKRRLRAGGR